MRLKDAVFGIIIAVLWYFSVFYLVAPHDIHNEFFGGFGMTHEEHHILGFAIFIVSLIVIMLWVSTMKDESDEKKLEQKATLASAPGSPSQPKPT